jgi:uncharacterized protein (DUF2249 family)
MVRCSAELADIALDIRRIPPWERYSRVLEELESLSPGEALSLVLDYDPRTLCFQLNKERQGEYELCSLERFPGEWLVTIRRPN